MSSYTLTRSGIHQRVSIPQINRSALSAGMSVLLIYLFAGLPIQIGVLTQLGLPAQEATSWFFITWLTTGVFSLALTLFTKQPVSINLSIPALIFLAGAAGGFSLPEIVGANLLVGLVAIGLSVFRLTDGFARLVPPQVALGVLAGSMLMFMWKTFQLASTDLTVSGPAIIGFALALGITRNHLLAVITAAVSGFLGVVVADGSPAIGGAVTLPQLSAPAIDLDPSAIVALGIPLLILTAGLGNIQSLAVLRSEGYKVRGNLFGLLAGIATVVNALGGGHAAAVGGSSTAVAAGADAGPQKSRFWSIVLSSPPVIVVALAAVPVIAIVQDLPVSYTLTVGALALVSPFIRVWGKTVDGPMRFGALVAFGLVLLPFQLVGMPMAFWALLAGTVATKAPELGRIRRIWRPGRALAEPT